MWNILGLNLASLPVAGSSRHRPAWRISSSSTPSSPAFPLRKCALLRSKGGSFSGLPFTVFPTSPAVRFGCSFAFFLPSSSSSFLFRLAPVWPSSRRPCHHRAACSISGVLCGFALESAAAHVCREAGARVSTSIFVRDLDLALLGGVDGRRGAAWPLTQLWFFLWPAAKEEDVPRTLWNTRARQTCALLHQSPCPRSSVLSDVICDWRHMPVEVG